MKKLMERLLVLSTQQAMQKVKGKNTSPYILTVLLLETILAIHLMMLEPRGFAVLKMLIVEALS